MKAIYYECGLYICFLKILNSIKNMKNMVFLKKKEVTDVINFGFSKLDEGKLISPVKNLFIYFKDSVDQKENII